MAPNISVIIPNNNNLSILRRMIQSIPDVPSIQIIVIDNNPTPLCADKISQGRTNVEVYYSDPIRGAGGARNEGLKQAKGQWLLFADADDFYTPEAFNIITKDIDSPYDIVYYGWSSCYSDTLLPADRNYAINQYIAAWQQGNETKLRYYWDSPCSKLIRTSLVRKHNIQFEECPAGNDMVFSVCIGTFAKKIKAVDKPVYCATILEGSIIHSPSKRNMESRFKAVIRLNTFLKSHGLRQYRHSIMSLWLKSWRVSPLLAIRLFFHSVAHGNSPFIGYTRWFSTTKFLISKKPKV